MERRLALVLVSLLGLGCSPGAAPAAADTPAEGEPLVVVAQSPAGVVELDPQSGAQLRLLVPGGVSPALSRDAKRLVFGLPDGPAQHLWVSDLDGTHRIQLTSGNAVDTTPDWSPDGRWIALCRATGSWPERHVRVAVVSSSGAVGGHAVPGTAGGCSPSWSPDSGLIAYSAADGVHATDPGGVGDDLITPLGTGPAWSPDGQTMAVTDVGGGDSDTTLVDIRSRQRRKITEFEGYHVVWEEPAWSPDGGSLYTSLDTETFPDEHNHTSIGTAVEHRDIDGTRSFWQDGVSSPSVGGGVAPPRDDVPPGPVAASATARISGIDVTGAGQPDPDAAGVVVRYAPGDIPPATPQDGLPGGRSVTGYVALRHLAAETTYAISVFPLDWSGNVGPRTVTVARTPHEVGTTLDIDAPQLVTYGQQAVVRGVLRRQDTGGPVAGAQLQLIGHLRGQPDQLLATLTTDADGAVMSSRLPSGETTYLLRYAGDDPLVAATDDATVRVRVAVAASLSAARVHRGGRVTLTVRLRPGLKQNKVYVEQRVNGMLRYRTTALTGTTGAVTVALDTRIRGTYTVTASSSGDGLRSYGISPSRTFAVT